MGYYDDHYEHIRQKQKGNRGGAFLAGVVGAILGGMLVVVTIPSLVKWDVLPYELEQTEEKQVTVTEQPKVDKSVAVDVVTQVTKAVNKVSDAVVGIVNIQEASFWSEGGEAGTGSG
ncbi:serine protease, partial [Geobacillus sp. LEMMJ02]